MFRTTESDQILTELIRKHQLSIHPLDPRKLREVLTDFMSVEFQCEEDTLLFQCGANPFYKTDYFELDFTRQFIIFKDDEYHHMEQLNFTFYYKNEKALSTLWTEKWSDDFTSFDDFFDYIESIEAFSTPVQHFQPLYYDVHFEEV